MPTGYHDNSNNPTNNFVLHKSATEDGRGIPAVGKLVYRTDLEYVEVCTATTPDAALNGGGTWSPITGSAVDSWTTTPEVFQGTVEFSVTNVYTSIRNDGVEVWGLVGVEIDAVTAGTYPADAVGEYVIVKGFPFACHATRIGFGRYTANIADTATGRIDGWVGILESTGAEANFTVMGLPTTDNLGKNETLASGDEILFEYRYPIA